MASPPTNDPQLWVPPVKLDSGVVPGSFAQETIVKRWPSILTDLIKQLEQDKGHADTSADKAAEAEQIIGRIRGILAELKEDKVLSRIGTSYSKNYDEMVAAQKWTWAKAPWLFGECYLYTLIRSFFTSSKYWTAYDYFADGKLGAFKSSGVGVKAVAENLERILTLAPTQTGRSLDDKEEQNAETLLFLEMAQLSLWGNATDLSLLTGNSYEDLQALQTTGAKEQEKRRRFILSDSFDATWAHLRAKRAAHLKDGGKLGRIDFVLDNAGFEFVCDLAFGEWLLHNQFASEVVFHPKTFPWFVSDVVPRDVSLTLNALQEDEAFFHDIKESGDSAVKRMSARWKVYFLDGRFKVAQPAKIHDTYAEALADPEAFNVQYTFWTEFYAYCDMPKKDPALLAELQKSDLVVFKGDLNYRKLTSDGLWEVDTPFTKAIGPLNGQFPLLSLRTNKATVIVGVSLDAAKKAAEEDPRWRFSGKWAVAEFANGDN